MINPTIIIILSIIFAVDNVKSIKFTIDNSLQINPKNIIFLICDIFIIIVLSIKEIIT